MRLIVNGAISPAFRMVSTDLLWEFGKEPPSGWQGNDKSPTLDMFLMIETMDMHFIFGWYWKVPASSRRTPVVLFMRTGDQFRAVITRKSSCSNTADKLPYLTTTRTYDYNN